MTSKHTQTRAAVDANYLVTEDGKVFSVSTNWRGYGRREMRQTDNASGYPSVRILVDGKRRHVAVHRLVAEKYLGPKPTEQHEVRHIDGNKSNNCVANLCWGTRAENAADREAHGRTSSGDRHSQAIKAGIAKSANPYWRHAR